MSVPHELSGRLRSSGIAAGGIALAAIAGIVDAVIGVAASREKAIDTASLQKLVFAIAAWKLRGSILRVFNALGLHEYARVGRFRGTS